jgi:hypothetical protein
LFGQVRGGLLSICGWADHVEGSHGADANVSSTPVLLDGPGHALR